MSKDNERNKNNNNNNLLSHLILCSRVFLTFTSLSGWANFANIPGKHSSDNRGKICGDRPRSLYFRTLISSTRSKYSSFVPRTLETLSLVAETFSRNLSFSQRFQLIWHVIFGTLIRAVGIRVWQENDSTIDD